MKTVDSEVSAADYPEYTGTSYLEKNLIDGEYFKHIFSIQWAARATSRWVGGDISEEHLKIHVNEIKTIAEGVFFFQDYLWADTSLLYSPYFLFEINLYYFLHVSL